MPSSYNEETVEYAAIDWLHHAGFEFLHGPSIAPGMPDAERDSFGDVVLVGRLKDALARLNPDASAEGQAEALRQLLEPAGGSQMGMNQAMHRLMTEGVRVELPDGLGGVRAPLALPGAVNAATFLAYVEQVLVPALRRGDVVVFDNLASHLSPAVSEAIGRAGASVLPLPPYSPDFNPIEEMISKFKEFLRRVGARAREQLYEAIGEGLREVTPGDILGWFRHAGLCVMQA